MIRRLLVSVSVLMLLSFTLSADDITGKWKGVVETPDGAFELFFTFSVAEGAITGTIDTGMSLEIIEKGAFKEDNDKAFTFEAYSEIAQQTLNYSAKIVEEKITIEIVGYDMFIDLEKVKKE